MRRRSELGLSDARFLRGGLVTVVASTTVAADAEGGVSPTRPAGYQAISGGADSSSNVGEVYLTGFGPQVEGSGVAALGDGQHGAPTAWRGFVRNYDTTTQTFKVVVTCAPIG